MAIMTGRVHIPPGRARRRARLKFNALSIVWALAISLLSACSSSSSAPSTVPNGDRPTRAEVSGCATEQPATWMGCLVKADPAFGRIPVSGLALPGSDNAGAFNLNAGSFDSQPGSTCSIFVPDDTGLGAVLTPFFETQDESITAQLDQGVRFIDLQVAYNGDGDALSGWRVVQSQFSDWPLYDYLDQVANWAQGHPRELVVLDLRHVCYDNGANRAVDEGLWANFDQPSDQGGGPASIADVAFNPGSLVSVASASIDQITGGAGRVHNVVVLLPKGLIDVSTLSVKYHVEPVITVAGRASQTPSGALLVRDEDAMVTPTSLDAVSAANAQLDSFPLGTDPAMGDLVGRGLYEMNLVYSFVPSEQASLLSEFGGLIESTSVGPDMAGGAPVARPAWEEGLWAPQAPDALSRNQILGQWGHRVNVVLADGVEYQDFVGAVIALNAR